MRPAAPHTDACGRAVHAPAPCSALARSAAGSLGACLPLLMVFVCILAFGMQGACYELDEEFKKGDGDDEEQGR